MKLRIFHAFIVIGMYIMITSATAKGPTIFENIVDVEAYAKTLEEYPPIDNDNWYNPDYSSHLETLVPSWIMRQLEKFGIYRGPWAAVAFKRLLKTVVNMRMHEGFQGRFAQKLEPVPGTKFPIFCELHGAFHSFVRDLRSLVEAGDLDESFNILKKDFYIVIDGNALVRGPYVLEMFTLVLRLMYVNQDHVIYIIGELEDKDRWEDFGLKQELIIRAAHVSNEKIPLLDLVKKFLKTLPLALYLIDGKTEKTINVVRISSYARDEKMLDEKNFAGALADPKKNMFSVVEKSKSDISIDVKAIIRRDPLLRALHRDSPGLVQYGKEEGATSWSLLSSPTGTFRALIQFYYDAYVILTTYASLDDWTLTLYNQDVRDMTGIRPVKMVKLITGTELSDEKIQANRIQGLQEKLKKTAEDIGAIQKELSAVGTTIGVPTVPGAPLAGVKPVSPFMPPHAIIPSPVPIKKQILTPAPEVREIKPPVSAPVATPAPVSIPAPEVKLIPSAPTVTPSVPTAEVKALPVTATVSKPEVEEKWAVPPTGDIIIGGTFDMSRNMKEQSASYIDGLESAFGQANELGGINGRNLVLQVKDDESDPFKAFDRVQEIREQYKTDLITGPIGWTTMTGIMDLVKKGEILSVFPYMATPAVRKPSIKYVINYMMGTLQTFFPMFKYAFDKMGVKKPALVYSREVGDQAVEIMMRGAQVKDYVKISITATDVNFAEQIKVIDKENPDLIVFLTYPTSAMNFMRQMKEKIHDKVIMIDASLVGDFFDRFIHEKVTRFIIGSAVPNPKKVKLDVRVEGEKEPLKLRIIENYKNAAEKKGARIDSIGLMGYISGRILVEILKKVQGIISKEKIIAAAESMKNIDLDGLPISFDQIRHQFAKYTFLDTSAEKEWFAIDVSKFPYFEEFLSPEDLAIKRKLEAEMDTGIKETKPEPSEMQVKTKEVIEKPANSETIKLGSTMDLSYLLQHVASVLQLSLESFFSQKNKEGGINGKKIELVVRNDEYDAVKARENINYFLSTLNIDTIISPLGTPTLESYLDKVKANQILVLFPVTGSPKFRQPDIKNIINFRCSYGREGEALAKYALENLHAQKIALFGEKNSASISGALEMLKKLNYTNYVEVNYEKQSASFKDEAQTIISRNPDVLILFAIPSAALGLLRELGGSIRTMKLMGISDLCGDAFQKPWRSRGQEIIISCVVPDPEAEEKPNTKYPIKLIQEFQKFAKDNYVPLDTIAFEGYINARIAVELYKQAGSTITKEKIIEIAQNLKDYSLGDMKLTFNPQTRELYNTIWLDTGTGEWKEIVFGSPTAQPA